MSWGEVAMWVLTIAVLTLTVVLYVRVDIHDWGMVGFTAMLFGASVLLIRWVMAVYALGHADDELQLLWRLLVLIGAPFALAGYILGLFREPPPVRQVALRLAVLIGVVALLAWWVEVGAADSGGAGYRMLRVQN